MLLEQGSVSHNQPERRSMRRFAMRLPASIRVSGIPREFVTETENVSARGVFFYLDRWMSVGAPVEVTMSFPPHVTLADPVRVRFVARVVRTDSYSPSHFGVAARIEEYEFLRPVEADGSVASAGMEPSWHFAG